MSDDVVAQIDASMNFPTTCPHGNVIPGRTSPYGELIALADLEPGTPATIRRISEVAEHEARALLLMLSNHDIHEGSEVEVTETELGPSEVEIVIGAKPLTLSIEAARLIWVDTRA
jgi:DtxR family Mn-dependent transcriptional regulator